jgi:excisionase family DNA binding protein
MERAGNQGWWPVYRVAQYFSCSVDCVYDWITSGQLEAIKTGKKKGLRVSVISIKGFEEKMRVESTEKYLEKN